MFINLHQDNLFTRNTHLIQTKRDTVIKVRRATDIITCTKLIKNFPKQNPVEPTTDLSDIFISAISQASFKHILLIFLANIGQFGNDIQSIYLVTLSKGTHKNNIEFLRAIFKWNSKTFYCSAAAGFFS